MRTTGKQCGLSATGDYQPSLRSPWLAASELDCFHWINTLLGNLKNSIRGTCHGFKVRKYAARYLAEAQYLSLIHI